MKWSWKVELPQLLAIAGMFGMAALLWTGAPDRIPTHWNLAGQVDGYGGKFKGLLGLPLAALGTYALLLVLPRIDPGSTNYLVFTGAYTAIRVSLLGLMVFIDALVITAMRHEPIDVVRLVSIAGGLLTVVLGATMGKVRPNWFVGIRTPWTLSSKVAWVRTHRAAGWVMVVTGLAATGVGLASGTAAFRVLMAGLLGGTVALIVYSYLVWRGDPDKIAPADTWPAE